MRKKKLRKYKKWVKFLQKDFAKGHGMKHKEIFGKNVPKTHYEIALEYLRKREIERIKYARQCVEEYMKDYIKRNHPEIKDFKIKWKPENIDDFESFIREIIDCGDQKATRKVKGGNGVND